MSQLSSIQKLRFFFAARDGMATTVCASLIDYNDEEVKELLEQEMFDDDGQRVTPLIVAARNGHDKVIKVLIQKFHPDLEHEGSVKVDGYIIEGATALWCAAGAGHLQVVKTLVKAGANVNHATVTNSTPLRAACFNGRLDVVKYLAEHNANIHISNKFNNTCLMIAAYKGHLEVVCYLLEKGVNPDEQAHCGATALLFASESGHTRVVMELLKYGASLVPNQFGMTPVLGAAERTRSEVVDYFMTRPELSLQEKVDALELLGASFANDKDHYCLDRAFFYLQKAMALRFEDDENPLIKPYYPPVPAYENWTECQSLQQLELIKYNENALHMESLTIRERIMGTNNPEVPHSVVFRGAVFADRARFDRCIELWLHALHLSQLNDLPVVKDLLRFAQVFSQMIHIRVELCFSHVESVLAAAVLELERNKEKLTSPGPKDDVMQLKDDMESNVITALYILVILTKLMKSCDPVEEHRVHQLVFRLNKLQVASRHGQTLLHLCVNSETPVDNFHTNDVCKFPCSATAKLLIQCGADVNAMDFDRNTPLHIIAAYGRHISDFMTLHSIIMELTEAGAHMDTVNMKGKTPFEIATKGEAEIILRTQTKLSLKCLAARAIQDHKIPYRGYVLDCLESFIQLHGSGSNEITKDEDDESRW